MRRLLTALTLISCCACSESDKEKVLLGFLDVPENYVFEHHVDKCDVYSLDDCDVEYYVQRNGPGTSQRVIMAFPKQFSCPVAAVVVPFYYPEAMLGYDPRSAEELPRYSGIEMMRHLARKGIATISGESYHLTYIRSNKTREDFSRWADAGTALLQDFPGWSGVGKLVHDTKLLIDILETDPRIDSDRIGIAGHSLGGKIAFYTGCLDSRIKVILASDFGLLWGQTNWDACWYWGNKLDRLKEDGIDNPYVLSLTGCKPFFLIAGEADNDVSRDAVMTLKGYSDFPDRFGFVNHATGHRPTPESLEKGYGFVSGILQGRSYP